MSRTKEGRDALRSPEAHPQARSIASAWAEWSQRRVPVGRHRPKSAETGEADPPSGADLRRMRRSGQPSLADGTPNPKCWRHNMGFFNKIDVERTSDATRGRAS